MAADEQLTGVRPGRGRQTAKKEKEAPTAMIERDVEIVVESLGSSGQNAPKNILIHGPSGHGKTLLAGGAFNGDRAGVFLSTEVEGIASARAVGSQAELIRCPDWEHAIGGVRWAERELGPEDWLVVDSGTIMQEMYMQWILDTENKLNPSRDLDIPAIQNHQKYQNGFKRWARRLISAQFNLIFITTSMAVDDGEDELIVPLLLGKKGEISSAISSQFSVAIYYAVARESREMTGPVTRRALCQPYPPWYAKDRYRALGKFWDVPEDDYWQMARMIEAIEEAVRKGEIGNGGRRARRTSRPRRPAA